MGTRQMDYAYALREWLPSAQIPDEFFSSVPARDMVLTIETSPEGAAKLVHLPLLYGGDTLLGHPLGKTVATINLSALTKEQVAFLYGDIAVTMSLLAQDPSPLRSGGRPVQTPFGEGVIFDDPGRAQLLVLNGRVALNVHGATEREVLEAARALRSVP